MKRIDLSIAAATLLISAVFAVPAVGAVANPWADTVLGYDPGVGPAEGFTDPQVVVGAPTTQTTYGPVHMFNAPWEPQHIVSIGDGGSLVVGFDEPVADDPLNPFGIDLLIFGNTGFLAEGPTYDTYHTHPAGVFGADGGTVSVSADGTDFVEVLGAVADGLYPTQPWMDADETIPADFARPVDPSVTTGSFDGLSIDESLAIYAGSGGGAGVDIAGTGLSEIRFVMISFAGAGNVEIDAFADVAPVPEPALTALLAAALVPALRRRSARL